EGEGLALAWIGPDERDGEKLATPDVSMADLVGEIDPIKVAEGRYLADEETIHYGLIPRTNRGLFAINELPDLTEKVQVGLFNLMEEKDGQIKGYKIRLPVDVVIVASANPEDYTSRGRIITPLKDRFDVQIRTHYPRTIEDEITIMEQEMPVFDREAAAVRIPDFMKEIVAHLTFEARGSNEINQSSGVSVRVTINNYESLVSNAEKRAVRLSEREIVPRLTDLHSILASTAGKIELEYVGEDKREDDLIDRLINRAVLKVWDKYLKVEGLKKVTEHFEAGWGVAVSDRLRAAVARWRLAARRRRAGRARLLHELAPRRAAVRRRERDRRQPPGPRARPARHLPDAVLVGRAGPGELRARVPAGDDAQLRAEPRARGARPAGLPRGQRAPPRGRVRAPGGRPRRDHAPAAARRDGRAPLRRASRAHRGGRQRRRPGGGAGGARRARGLLAG